MKNDSSLRTQYFLSLIISTVLQISIGQAFGFRDQRVKVIGWVERIRHVRNNLMFVTVGDTSGVLQCVLKGDMVSNVCNRGRCLLPWEMLVTVGDASGVLQCVLKGDMVSNVWNRGSNVCNHGRW